MCIACEKLLQEKWLSSPAPKVATPLVLTENLEELVPFIDWKYFLYAWGYPLSLNILEEESLKGESARNLLSEGKNFLKEAIENKYFEARAIVGIFPVERHNEDVKVKTPSGNFWLHFYRQQNSTQKYNRSLVDFLNPNRQEYMGFFAASVGFGVEEFAQQNKENDYHSMLAETISGRLTEAFSEKLHRDVIQKYWGYAPHKIFGIRPAIGYPSIPDHSEKQTLWQLLDVENRIGIKLTDSHMMLPLNSVCGYYFAHPQSCYFSVGKIGLDQLEDYNTRKKKTSRLKAR